MAEKNGITRRQLEALANFRYRLRLFLRYSERITREHGLTPLQYQLMLQVKGFPGRDWATVSELAERLQAHHHGVVSLVTRCEKAGLVARKPHEHDRRTVKVELTPKGEKVLMKLAALHLRAHRGQYMVPTLAPPHRARKD
ncbi:MAG TPA: MarR family transcriptional regulator [Steroidobacteraceae bacterium]